MGSTCRAYDSAGSRSPSDWAPDSAPGIGAGIGVRIIVRIVVRIGAGGARAGFLFGVLFELRHIGPAFLTVRNQQIFAFIGRIHAPQRLTLGTDRQVYLGLRDDYARIGAALSAQQQVAFELVLLGALRLLRHIVDELGDAELLSLRDGGAEAGQRRAVYGKTQHKVLVRMITDLQVRY